MGKRHTINYSALSRQVLAQLVPWQLLGVMKTLCRKEEHEDMGGRACQAYLYVEIIVQFLFHVQEKARQAPLPAFFMTSWREAGRLEE